MHGGGLFINPPVWATLRNVTIVDNRADFGNSGGGGLLRGAGSDGGAIPVA